MTTNELRAMFIDNFILFYESSDKGREKMRSCLADYLNEVELEIDVDALMEIKN